MCKKKAKLSNPTTMLLVTFKCAQLQLIGNQVYSTTFTTNYVKPHQ